MHLFLHLLVLWALAFVTLFGALFLMATYFALIGYDLELRGLYSELIVAGICALIEAASAWLLATFAPSAVRGLVIPALMVALIYKIAHLEDWGRFEVLMLFVFQIFISCFIGLLIFGRFGPAVLTLVALGLLLVVIGAMVKNFDG